MQQLALISDIRVDQETFEEVVRRTRSKSYYACYPVFVSFLNSGIRRVSRRGNSLILHYKGLQFSIFEKIEDEGFVYTNQGEKGDEREREYIYDVRWVASMPSNHPDKKVRHAYRSARNQNIDVLTLDKVDTTRIMRFLDVWKQQHHHYFRLTTRRDYKLFEVRDELNLNGIAVIDRATSEVIAASAFTPHPIDNELAVCIFGKGLRTYRNLDMLVGVETGRLQKEVGFRFSNDSCANTSGLSKFKDQFMGGDAHFNTLYSSNRKEKL